MLELEPGKSYPPITCTKANSSKNMRRSKKVKKRTSKRTMVQISMILRQLIIHFPTSAGVSEPASKQYCAASSAEPVNE